VRSNQHEGGISHGTLVSELPATVIGRRHHLVCSSAYGVCWISQTRERPRASAVSWSVLYAVCVPGIAFYLLSAHREEHASRCDRFEQRRRILCVALRCAGRGRDTTLSGRENSNILKEGTTILQIASSLVETTITTSILLTRRPCFWAWSFCWMAPALR